MNDLFKGTAIYYAKYRPNIPEEVVSYIKSRFDLDGKGTLLDLGCGPGQSTFAMAPLFNKSVGVDPDEDMIRQAISLTPKNLKIHWRTGSDKEITVSEGPYRLVIISRAFHWMDQYPTLDKVKKISEPNGGICLIGDGSFWTGKEPWQMKTKKIVQEFLGEKRRAGKKTFTSSEEPYTEMLVRKGFKRVEKKTFVVERKWNIESIIGCLHSTSFAAPHLFGTRLSEFEARLKSELIRISEGNGSFVEKASFDIQSGMIS